MRRFSVQPAGFNDYVTICLFRLFRLKHLLLSIVEKITLDMFLSVCGGCHSSILDIINANSAGTSSTCRLSAFAFCSAALRLKTYHFSEQMPTRCISSILFDHSLFIINNNHQSAYDIQKRLR